MTKKMTKPAKKPAKSAAKSDVPAKFSEERWGIKRWLPTPARPDLVGVMVSTVELPSLTCYPPFETMVFKASKAPEGKEIEVDSFRELWCDRYSTKWQAVRGHKKITDMIKSDGGKSLGKLEPD